MHQEQASGWELWGIEALTDEDSLILYFCASEWTDAENMIVRYPRLTIQRKGWGKTTISISLENDCNIPQTPIHNIEQLPPDMEAYELQSISWGTDEEVGRYILLSLIGIEQPAPPRTIKVWADDQGHIHKQIG